jgi:hypothetical protein
MRGFKFGLDFLAIGQYAQIEGSEDGCVDFCQLGQDGRDVPRNSLARSESHPAPRTTRSMQSPRLGI